LLRCLWLDGKCEGKIDENFLVLSVVQAFYEIFSLSILYQYKITAQEFIWIFQGFFQACHELFFSLFEVIA
jgi:hypothetical protein